MNNMELLIIHHKKLPNMYNIFYPKFTFMVTLNNSNKISAFILQLEYISYRFTLKYYGNHY